ncbi:LuxR C-terminal-related transcriptional regulator [Chloroflexota bacterium]
MEQLLTTKFFVPQTRAMRVLRPRLIAQLNAHPHHRLTLISAPAGFGKTTLVSEWTENLCGAAQNGKVNNNRIAWLSLDEGDNDPTRFLVYVVGAMRRAEGIDKAMGENTLNMLHSPQPPPIKDVLTALINDIAAIPTEITFVLDDYHVIDSSHVNDAVTFLLEYAPDQFHLVIATRDDPRLPLARLRGRNQLTELRAADLRFTSAEAAEFLNQVMNLNLSVENIAALEARTEGWIAGLQLAAISMRGHQDTTNFVQSFSGSHRFVLDYLIEEVLDQQPADIQTFLLQTAVLDRLTGPLCEALTGTAQGHIMLQTLEQANLFIIPLDEERRWYRYHHLFADLLRQRLHQMHPDWVAGLHQSASIWYEQQGYIDEAIEHALKADDYNRATRLIDRVVEDMWTRNEHSKFQRWLDSLPETLVLSMPHLCIFHAWALFATGQQDAAERSLQAAEATLEPDEPNRVTTPDVKESQLQGRIAVTRAFLAFFRNDGQALLQHARQALDYLPADDLAWRSTAVVALGDAYTLQGDTVKAYHAYLEAVEANQAAGNVYMILVVSMKLAIVLRGMGQLQQTINICQKQLQFAQENAMAHTAVAGCLSAIWGEALAEFNELDQAAEIAQKGVALTDRGGDVAMQGWAYLCLVRILFSRGELAEAEAVIQKLAKADRELDIPAWLMAQIATWQARIWLTQGKMAEVNQWVERHERDAEGNPIFQLEVERLVYARILLMQNRLQEATELLQTIGAATEAGERTSRLIECLILRVLVFQAGNNMEQALVALERALTVARSGGFVQMFVDEGSPMAQLLYEVLQHDIEPDYVRQLLTAFPIERPVQLDSAGSHTSEFELIEPLSDREIEVLHLIAKGLTNQEVATKLYLSLNTVKVHARNIYDKLGVHNRTQAVARARVLGILHPD